MEDTSEKKSIGQQEHYQSVMNQVSKNMPPVYPADKVYKSKRQQLPYSFKQILDDMMAWENVNEESSAPVQRAATQLREAFFKGADTSKLDAVAVYNDARKEAEKKKV